MRAGRNIGAVYSRWRTEGKNSLKNEQDHDLFQGVVQRVAGKSDLAQLAAIAVFDVNRFGGYFADHFACMDNGSGFQLNPSFYLFFVWLTGSVICSQIPFL